MSDQPKTPAAMQPSDAELLHLPYHDALCEWAVENSAIHNDTALLKLTALVHRLIAQPDAPATADGATPLTVKAIDDAMLIVGTDLNLEPMRAKVFEDILMLLAHRMADLERQLQAALREVEVARNHDEEVCGALQYRDRTVIPDLRAQLAAAQAERDDAIADRERLDWLEGEKFILFPDSTKGHKWDCGSSGNFITYHGETARQAIDAARAAIVKSSLPKGET